VSGPPFDAGTESGQFGDLGLDELDTLFERERVVAIGRVEVKVKPVLAGIRLRHALKPDRRAQPVGVEEPVVEGGLGAEPGPVMRPPGCLRLAGLCASRPRDLDR
jgi:hypothetical protein